MRYLKGKTDGRKDSSAGCKICGETPEIISHIVSRCIKSPRINTAQQSWQHCVLGTPQAIQAFREKCQNLDWVQMERMKA